MKFVEELIATSYALPSENGVWVSRQNNTVPMNICIRAADEIESLTAENEKLRAAIMEARAVAEMDGLGQWVAHFDKALSSDQQQAPHAWVEAKKEVDDGWPDR